LSEETSEGKTNGEQKPEHMAIGWWLRTDVFLFKSLEKVELPQ
jgi:hypothetical protein